jgi:hypothetical protein
VCKPLTPLAPLPQAGEGNRPRALTLPTSLCKTRSGAVAGGFCDPPSGETLLFSYVNTRLKPPPKPVGNSSYREIIDRDMDFSHDSGHRVRCRGG